ncbi:hypothetical protein M5K25_026785 [Dendrobium thyrsiflorum]|uniref:Uncharacterized protein n=1 Tax=Dendrobium thyrsiflorum TaxID=117978 RepID=A0ABD0TY43_DENTH
MFKHSIKLERMFNSYVRLLNCLFQDPMSLPQRQIALWPFFCWVGSNNDDKKELAVFPFAIQSVDDFGSSQTMLVDKSKSEYEFIIVLDRLDEQFSVFELIVQDDRERLTETLEESVRVRERLRFRENERSCKGLSEEITEVSQGESLVLLLSLFARRLVKPCVKTPVSAWVLCLHRGVVKKEEAVLCRRKSGSLPEEEWFSAVTKEWVKRTTLPSSGRELQLPFSPLLGDGREPSSSGIEPLFLPSAKNRNTLPSPGREPQHSSFSRQRTATLFLLPAENRNLLFHHTPRTTLPSSGREPQLPFSPLLGDGREPSSSDREPLFLPSAENRNTLPSPDREPQHSSFSRQRTATLFLLPTENRNLLFYHTPANMASNSKRSRISKGSSSSSRDKNFFPKKTRLHMGGILLLKSHPLILPLFSSTQLSFILTLTHSYHKKIFLQFLSNLIVIPDYTRMTSFVMQQKTYELFCILELRDRLHTLIQDYDISWSFVNETLRGNKDKYHQPRVYTLHQNARIIQHVLRSCIIPKAGDRVNMIPLLSLVTHLIMSDKPFDEAQLILDYIRSLTDIRHPQTKRKKNIALGHLGEDLEGEREVPPEPAPAPNQNAYQDMIQKFDTMEVNFGKRFDQIELHMKT